MGSPFAEGYVQKCLSTLKQCSKEFVYRSYLKNLKELETSQTKEVNEDQIESTNQEDNFYSDFFNEVPIQKPRMNDEAIKFKFTTELDKEISALTLVISSANFSKDKKSLPEFWSKNSSSLPILCSLAKVLINISSSSAFIERFFSISGIICTQRNMNMNKDLIVARSLLKANPKIIQTLKNQD